MAFARQLRRIYHSLYFAPLIVFVSMSLIVYWSWQANKTALDRDINSAVMERSEQLQDSIKQKLAAYEQIITGGAGLIRGSHDVMKNEWHDYVSTFNISRDYKGVYGIGYIKTFDAAQLPLITQYMHDQGVSDFQIKPDTSRDTYTAILYSEPEQTNSPVGQDLFAEPKRMASMIRARDSGMISLSPPLKSLRNITDQAVMVMFTPQYRNDRELPHTTEERRQAIEGYVYAGFRTGDFFDYVTRDFVKDGIMAVQISAASASDNDSTVFYKSADYERLSNTKGYAHNDQWMEAYGQKLHLQYSYKLSNLVRPQRLTAPVWTLVGGFLFALLLAEAILLLLKARARELSHLKEQAVNLAKDELLSLASHQLRTPATTVKQYLGMVLQGFAGDITPTQHSLLDKAYAGNERQLYIINEMLHIAKIDAGRIVLAKHKTDVGKLVGDIVEEARVEAEEARHSLRLSLPKKPLYLKVDEPMLRMAIENIVSNAIKYTPAGGKIHVKVAPVKNTLQISVKDSGIGIDQKDFAKLYQLFTRLDNKRLQNVSGTGVGLYLAKHLVELHKGSLTFTSKPDKGSTFIISLPMSAYRSKKP